MAVVYFDINFNFALHTTMMKTTLLSSGRTLFYEVSSRLRLRHLSAALFLLFSSPGVLQGSAAADPAETPDPGRYLRPEKPRNQLPKTVRSKSLKNTAVNSISFAEGYFRSAGSGYWNSVTSWEYSSDGSVWTAASAAPDLGANTISIQPGHTVTVAAPVAVDQVIITNGGVLNVASSGFIVNDGTGDDVIIRNGGTLKYSAGSNYAGFSGAAPVISVESGGMIWVGIAGLANTQVANYVYKDASILEWGLTDAFTSGVTYFPNASEEIIPIFRFTDQVGTVGAGSGPLLVNGVLEANGNITFAGTNSKTFRNGVRGSGTITQGPNSGKIILGNSTTVPEIGGSVSLNVVSSGLMLPNGANIPVDAKVKLTSSAENNTVNRDGGVLTVNGTLDLTNMRISNSAPGSVTVNGTLKTAHSGGLYDTGAAIASGILTLNSNSTVEYNAITDQRISSGPAYYHIIFSGAAVKTTQGSISVHGNGSVKITGTTTVNANSNLGSTKTNDTAFMMDGGRLVIRTGGTQPNMQGVYNLTGGVIEFAGTSKAQIRIGAPAKEYYNVAVSGTQVETGGKNFIVKNILSVNSGGVLTVPETATKVNSNVVTARKGLQVAAGGTVLFKNNAQLLQDADAVNTGNVTVLRNSTMKRLDYTYWGAPVAGQPFQPFSPQTVGSRFYTYNEADNSFTSIPDPAAATFLPGKGYAIRAPNNASPTNYDLFEGRFTGTPNNGSYFFDLKYSGPNQGLNMISNPYPSNIDLRVLTVNNTALTDGIYYFWTNNANSGTGNPTQTPTGSYGNYSVNQYATLNAMGATPASSGAEGSAVFPSAIVRPGQGFLIKAKAAGSLVFDHSIRTAAISDGKNSSVFFNERQENEEPAVPVDRFWLKLVTPANNRNVLLIGYAEGASDAYDPIYDAEAMSASDQFYSIVDGKLLAIQGKSFPLSDEEVVVLGASFYEPGTYLIGIEGKEGVFETGKAVYLHDKKLNTYTDLQNQDYRFTTENGTDNGRFELRYEEGVLGTADLPEDEAGVYRDGDNFVVRALSEIRELTVYDAAGRVVTALKPNRKEVVIPVNRLEKGFYLITIKTDHKISGKKIVR